MANLDLQRTERNDNRAAFICIFLVSVICDHFAEQPLRGGDLGSCRSRRRSARAILFWFLLFFYWLPSSYSSDIAPAADALSIYVCATQSVKKLLGAFGRPPFAKWDGKRRRCVREEDIYLGLEGPLLICAFENCIVWLNFGIIY